MHDLKMFEIMEMTGSTAAIPTIDLIVDSAAPNGACS